MEPASRPGTSRIPCFAGLTRAAAAAHLNWGLDIARKMVYNAGTELLFQGGMAMIQVVLGKRGSGKSKRLIDLANEALKTEHGLVVFVDDDKNNMYDLRHEVRLVDASEFALGEYRSASWFYGLLGGMLAINFDISLVFVDAFMKLVNCTDPNLLEPLFNQMESLSREHNVNFVLGVSGDPEALPEFITRYAV